MIVPYSLISYSEHLSIIGKIVNYYYYYNILFDIIKNMAVRGLNYIIGPVKVAAYLMQM